MGRYTLQLFIIHVVAWLSLLCNFAVAQFDISEGLTGSTSFPDVAISCLGNLAVFLICLVRGRLHAEMGVRDLLASITGPKLHDIGGFGLTTCRYIWEANANEFVLNLRAAEVVMLSKQKPNRSMRQFMKYTSHVYGVPSIQLQSLPLTSVEDAAEICYCRPPKHACKCIVFNTVQDITVMLAERMPGTLKKLSDSKCLLPCLSCLRNGCHGCNQSLLHVEDVGEKEAGRKTLKEGEPRKWPVAAVCEILTLLKSISKYQRSCICIPTRPAENDEWTKMLISSLKTKDEEARGVVSLSSDALQNYIAQSGECDDAQHYGTISVIVPRLAEIFVNILLTGWLRIDGFSSALVARRAIKDYVVDSRGSGIAGNAFLTKSRVYSNVEHTTVCQVLTFRGSLLSFGTLSFVISFVNLICSITWSVLIALEGGRGKWYEPYTLSPTKPILDVIMVAMGIDLVLHFLRSLFNMAFSHKIPRDKKRVPKRLKDVRGDGGVEQGGHGRVEQSGRGDGGIEESGGHGRVEQNVRGIRAVDQHGRRHGHPTFIRSISMNGMVCMMTVATGGRVVILVLEIGCIVLGAREGLQLFGRWLYAVLQALVWLKWGIGSVLLTHYSLEYDRDIARIGIRQGAPKFLLNAIFVGVPGGSLLYASTFLLNAIFVGVRGNWKYLPSSHFSFRGGKQ